jgi:pimeloyl-ACP methyl ester carboxylesterase
MSDEERLSIARSREAYAYFGWKPYMHNPSLRRWLRRIKIPTLVFWGSDDGIVTPDYGRAFAAEMPNAQFSLIEQAGHYPQTEQPERVLIEFDRFFDAAPLQYAAARFSAAT